MCKKTSGLSRRNFILTGSVASAGLLRAGRANAELAAAPQTTGKTIRVGEVTVQGVSFRNNEIILAGNIYRPKDFSEQRNYAAIVAFHPGSLDAQGSVYYFRRNAYGSL